MDRQSMKFLWPLLAIVLLASCESDGGMRTEFALKGYVDDLDGSIELALNGASNVVVENTYDETLAASFEFPRKLQNGEAFEVTIVRQPEHHYCEVLEPEGVFNVEDRPIAYVNCDRAVEVFSEVEVSAYAIGADHVCALVGKDLHCFGGVFRHDDVWAPPRFDRPPVFDAGNDVNCAADGVELRCWGSWADNLNQLKPQVSGGVRELGVGWRSACLIDDDGLKCWGDPNNPIVQSYPKDLAAPEQLVVRVSSACVVDQGKPYCWAFAPGIETAPEGLDDVVALDPVADHVCAVRAWGAVVCWPEVGSATAVPTDLNPAAAVSTQLSHTCAVTFDGLRCWGEDPYLTHLEAILGTVDSIRLSGGVGGSIGCALAEGRLFCFGRDIQNGVELPDS